MASSSSNSQDPKKTPPTINIDTVAIVSLKKRTPTIQMEEGYKPKRESGPVDERDEGEEGDDDGDEDDDEKPKGPMRKLWDWHVSRPWLVTLVICVPGFVVGFAQIFGHPLVDNTWGFILPMLGILVTSSIFNTGTDDINECARGIAAIVASGFGNVVELCVLFISIFQKRIPIVQYPLMASPILNILMVLGMALVSGGLVKQRAKNTTPKGDASEELSLLNATGAPAGVSSNPAESSTTKPPERRSLMARLRILNRTAKQKEQARMVTPMENLSYYYQVIAMIGNPTAIKSQATMALVLALTLFAYAWTAWFMEDYPSRHQRFLQAVGLGIAVLFWGVFAILMYYQFVTHKEDMEADQQPPRLSEPRLTRSRTHSVNPRTWQDGVEQRSRANSANSNSKRDDGEGTSPARTPVSPSPGLLGIPGKQPSEGAVEPSSSPAAESTTSQTQGDNATAPTEQKKWRKNMTVEEIQAEEVAAWKEVWGEKPNFVLLLFGFLWLPRPKLLPKVPKKGDHESDEHKKIRRRYLMYCFQMLAMASLITGFLCQFAVTNLEAFAEETGLNIYFVLGFLQPFIGNVVEHVTAVVQAIKGNVDLAYGICLSSSLQLMLVLIPLVPIFTDAVGARTDKVLQLFLPYDPWIATMLLIACVTLFAVSIDTEYDYLEGIGLIVILAIYMMALPWVPMEEKYNLPWNSTLLHVVNDKGLYVHS